ncbi:MAG: hypothetical protein DRZ80_01325 [Thermoprotei archaeon]|nr:MAG: hypothetical protein DRZ80_01325 [Thermoprotei archaeon]
MSQVVGPTYLGPVGHPALGIRIPEILLPGILKAFKKRNVAGGLMLSFGRETAPEWVINAPYGKYEITQGHTGTSIRKYMTMAAKASIREGLIVEIEADHLTIAPSSAEAVKRISEVKYEYRMSKEELEKSINYVKAEIDEAVSTGYVNFYTIDTCFLIDYSVKNLGHEQVKSMFFEIFGDCAKDILKRYSSREYIFIGELGIPYKYNFSQEEVMKFAIKYAESLKATKLIYDYIKSKMTKPFGVEIAFDETPVLTDPKEMLFYMKELWEMGIRPDFIAPNIGFKKRKDYSGDLKSLERRVDRLSAIAKSFGSLISIHSGSGTTPYSGKGIGTYEALLKATGGAIKYKISGVYIELLFDLLASYPKGTRQRELFETIFDNVYDFLKKQIEQDGILASPELKAQLELYEKEVSTGVREEKDSRADFFRYYSFIALNLRDSEDRRFLRESIVELYNEDVEFRERYDKEVEALTLRLIDGLKYENNVLKVMEWLTRQ